MKSIELAKILAAEKSAQVYQCVLDKAIQNRWRKDELA